MKNSVLKHLNERGLIKQRVDWAVKEMMELCKRVKELPISTPDS